MDKNMKVPEGTNSGSSLWFSSPTPRHRFTHRISEQDRCPVWAHLSVRARAHAHARSPRGRGWGGGRGSGWSRCKPRDCLRQAKGAPGGDGTAGRRVSWKPNANAEGLAGRAEATQVCSGSRESGPRPPAPRGPGGAGAAGGIQESGRAAGAKGPLLVGKKPRAPGIPRWSPIQDPNQARPCLASEIRRDRAPSG